MSGCRTDSQWEADAGGGVGGGDVGDSGGDDGATMKV
jgi:hypothetical protein